MCDTMVALSHTTKNQAVIFAKNSDRQPNEPLLMMYYPRKTYPKHSRLQCTYIEVDQVEATNAIFIFQPAWMWGCEMGTNEHGLTIGNEAVFTKEKVNKTGLLGMDLIRLALERCKTSEEALDLITTYLEKYGQGGNCGYEKPFTYHNAFLITDDTSAWVLETAGDYWAAEQVSSTRAISNRLSIGEDFTKHHPELITYAQSKGWYKETEPFHFAKNYSDFLYTKLSGAKEREHCSSVILENKQGNITEKTMIDILTTHDHKMELAPLARASVKSVCMHAGLLYEDQTTGSYIVSLKKKEPIVAWVTGASTPCISLFKPLELFTEAQTETKRDEALHYWLEREQLHRMLMQASQELLQMYMEERAHVQQEIFQLANDKKYNDAWQLEAAFVQKYRDKLLALKQRKQRGNLLFQYYWKKQNKRLYEKHASFFRNAT